MKRLKLLAIIEAYSITGPAKNLLEFARLAGSENIHTTIATFTRGAADNLFTQTVRDLAARNEHIALECLQERGAFDRNLPGALREMVSRVRPDVLQTHAVKSHFLTRVSGLPASCPWVAFHHGYTWPDFKARAYNQLDRWSLKPAAKVLTVSGPFREEIVAFGVSPAKIEVIHNAIPPSWGLESRSPEKAASLRARLGIPADRKIALIVGRLSREKDHLTLLEALSRLPEPIRPHLVIVGDGPERSNIEARVRARNMGHLVTLAGQHATAEPFYGIADVAVLSSLSEGSPNALLEAMATEVPVVATRVGGIPEIVADGESALLIPPQDVTAMSNALRRVLTEPELARQLSLRSALLIRERHEPAARMRRLNSIYRSLCGCGHSAPL